MSRNSYGPYGAYEGSDASYGQNRRLAAPGAPPPRTHINARLYALVVGGGTGSVVRQFSTLARAEQALREHQLRHPGRSVRIVAPGAGAVPRTLRSRS